MSWVGLGRVCAQPGLDLNYSGEGKYGPKPTQMIWSDFPVWVLSILGCIGRVSGFITGNDFWLDLVEI